MNERWFISRISIFVLFLIGFVPIDTAQAQVLSLEITPSASLESAEVLNISTLGIDDKGGGPALVSAFLENLTNEKLENLYLEINISASKVGKLIELKSDYTSPFSLRPNQSVYATDKNLEKERLPGVKEKLSFTGGFTPEGDAFLEDLSGATDLPADIYSIQVIVFQVTDATGRTDLVQATAEVGTNSVYGFEQNEVYLEAPGDVVEAQAQISNPYPQFSWEGPNNMNYRLIVVKDNGTDSPESLIQSAKSTNSTTNGGSLLEFENLDVDVKRNTYQFPSSGAQALESGNTYYWSVVTSRKKRGDTSEKLSEIWSFELMNAGSGIAEVPVTNEVRRALMELIGADRYAQLRKEGFTLEGITFDGQEFNGPAATVALENILQKIRDEELTLGSN